MKHFIYFESEEGGMSENDVTCASDLTFLHGWLMNFCKEQDEDLVKWMETAEVGEYKGHRLGVLVRMKDQF